MQTQQRHALAGLLKINAMLAPEQVEMHVATDDRLECHAHAAAPEGRSLRSRERSLRSWGAQLGQRFLEVAQIGHEYLQIAFRLEGAPFDQRHQVMRAGRWLAAAEFFPFRFRRAQRKR